MKHKRVIHVCSVVSEYGIDTFSNLTKLIKAYPNLDYRKVYYALKQRKEYKKDIWQVYRTVLK